MEIREQLSGKLTEWKILNKKQASPVVAISITLHMAAK